MSKMEKLGKVRAEDVVSRFRNAVLEVAPNLSKTGNRSSSNNAGTLLKEAKRSEDRAARLLR